MAAGLPPHTRSGLDGPPLPEVVAGPHVASYRLRAGTSRIRSSVLRSPGLGSQIVAYCVLSSGMQQYPRAQPQRARQAVVAPMASEGAVVVRQLGAQSVPKDDFEDTQRFVHRAGCGEVPLVQSERSNLSRRPSIASRVRGGPGRARQQCLRRSESHRRPTTLLPAVTWLHEAPGRPLREHVSGVIASQVLAAQR